MRWPLVSTVLWAPLLLSAAGPQPAGRIEPLAPNELGRVLIVMYHGVAAPESEWQRTPEAFRKDLESLYDRGYRPIGLRDFAKGEISTPKGLSPVILTFDDGRPNNLDFIDSPTGRRAAPHTAVGILEDFAALHPDFPLKATFFLSGKRPFGEAATAKEKVQYLIDKGMDIGNHTDSHANLSLPRYASAQAIQRSIGLQSARLEAMAGPGYTVDTYALCHGARPQNRSLWPFLVAGAHQGHSYRHVAVLNVGGPPALSPFDSAFNPASLPRIRGSDHPSAPRGLSYWLHRFDKDPDSRFVSDGDPHLITAPASQSSRIDPARLEGRRLYLTGTAP
jgi:peptidoglycan/xylan/chitin deacetylase (PgdA/CDA1 family)